MVLTFPNAERRCNPQLARPCLGGSSIRLTVYGTVHKVSVTYSYSVALDMHALNEMKPPLCSCSSSSALTPLWLG